MLEQAPSGLCPVTSENVVIPNEGKNRVDLCILVGIECEVSTGFLVFTRFEFRKVSVVVSFHLQVKHLRFSIDCSRNQVLIQEFENIGTDVCQFVLNLNRENRVADEGGWVTTAL